MSSDEFAVLKTRSFACAEWRTDNLICENQIGPKVRHLYRFGMKKD